MSDNYDIDRELYECECSYDAAVSYESDVVRGLVVMGILRVSDYQTRVMILREVELKTANTFNTILHNLKVMMLYVMDANKFGYHSSKEIDDYIHRILRLTDDIKSHKVEDEDLILNEYK